MRAIVIDDSRAMRTIIGKLLRELGFEITEAQHGQEAIERLQQSGPLDLALVDWNMPQMNGIEFVQNIRAQTAFDPMRLMMVTTETEISHVMMALTAGANEYVMKPFTKDTIREKLEIMGMQLP